MAGDALENSHGKVNSSRLMRTNLVLANLEVKGSRSFPAALVINKNVRVSA